MAACYTPFFARGKFSLMQLQILLFIVAAAALVFKRYCRIVECKYYPKPKRSLFVWFLDVSKQVLCH